MSNEVTNEAEGTLNNQATASEQTETKTPAETAAEATTGAVEAPEPTDTDSGAGAAEEAEDNQNQGEMDFGAMLAQFEQEQVSYSSGETVTGKVVRVSDQGVLIDFGYKSEGVVAIEEFRSPEGEVTINQGDDIEVVIKRMGGDGPPILSFVDAKNRRSWDEIENAFRDDTVVKGLITDKTKGGLKVKVEGVEAFLPGSQVDSRPVRNLDSLIGQEIETKVVKFSRKRNNIVLSRKVITDEVINEQKAETLSQIEVGYIVDGIVKNLTEYGAFIDIGGIDGLLHVTDMSWGRLHKPGDQFNVADPVQVKVLKLDREKEKVSLGFKQLQPDPWSTVAELYPVESKVKGKVSSVTEYGAFVELEPGVEGLVHISEMSWAKRMKHPKHFVSKGDEVEVQVLGIDPDERRISLGIKQLQPNPWDSIGERYQTGSKIHGKVRNLTDFGAFVEIEDGVDGLVHVSDISWSKKVKHPKDVLKKGQEVDAIVTNIDVPGRRLSLSIKELTPSAWETFTNEHKAGNVVKGTISRFAGFGIFVELAPDLEGLCHISELSDERIENPEDQFEIGQELDFKILRIEQDVEKIGLSARAVGKEDEPSLDTKTYSSEAKGGMASLGELANLNLGGGEEPAEEEAEPKKKDGESEEAKAEDEKPAEAESEAKETKAETDESAAAESKDESPVEAVDSKEESEETAEKSAEKDEKPPAKEKEAEVQENEKASGKKDDKSDEKDEASDAKKKDAAAEQKSEEDTEEKQEEKSDSDDDSDSKGTTEGEEADEKKDEVKDSKEKTSAVDEDASSEVEESAKKTEKTKSKKAES